jgi:hypothetical protein
MSAFEIRKLDVFWKISVDQTVRIYGNNLDCKVFKLFHLHLTLGNTVIPGLQKGH